MGRQIKGSLYFFITDNRHSLMIFWTILLSILVVSLAFSYFLLSVEDGAFYFGFPFAIYFYCGVLGFLTVKESIPFSLKVGAVRKNIFIAIGLFFLLVAFVKAIVANTIQSLTLAFAEAAGIHTFSFLHPAQLLENTWLNRVLIDTSIMFFLMSFMFIIGLLFYKSGLLGGGNFVGVLAVVLLLGIAQGWLFDFFSDLFAAIDMVFFIQLFAAGVILYGISFVFVRRITTVKVK